MKLTIIGCSGSMSGPESPASGYLVEATGNDAGTGRDVALTLDFGPGVMGKLLAYRDPALLDAMLFSHLHADHCADLVGMQVYRRWYPGGEVPRVPLYSPQDGRRRLIQLADDDPTDTYEGEFDFHHVNPGDSFEVGPLHVEAFAANHTVEALCYRITGPSDARPGEQATLTFTGDTDYAPSVVEAARGADTLLSEAAFEEGRDTVRGVHMTGKRAGELAHEAGVRDLLLTHLQPWTDPDEVVTEARGAFSGRITAVRAGQTYRI